MQTLCLSSWTRDIGGTCRGAADEGRWSSVQQWENPPIILEAETLGASVIEKRRLLPGCMGAKEQGCQQPKGHGPHSGYFMPKTVTIICAVRVPAPQLFLRPGAWWSANSLSVHSVGQGSLIVGTLFPILPPNMPPYKHIPKGERAEVQSHLILLRSTDTVLLQTGGCGRPALSKPVGTIFPTASAPFVALLPVNHLCSISDFSITTEFVLATRDITVAIVLGASDAGPPCLLTSPLSWESGLLPRLPFINSHSEEGKRKHVTSAG